MAQDMTALTSRIIWIDALFIFVFLSGFWLYRSGHPFNTVILTVHKLIGLGALILIGVTIYQVNQVTTLSTTVWIAIVVTGSAIRNRQWLPEAMQFMQQHQAALQA